MLFTPVYGWPYLERYVDPLTYRAISGEAALLAIEPVVNDIDNRVADIEALALGDLRAPGWSSYTPAWTSDGTLPALNNGTLTGAQRKAANADLTDIRFKLTRGSTSTNGTGAYFISVPAGAATEVGYPVGTWYMTTATQHYSGVLKLHTSTTVLLVRDTGTITSASPAAMVTGDVIAGHASYQPA